jgi:transcriptional regulator with XRE-family HTH domain
MDLEKQLDLEHSGLSEFENGKREYPMQKIIKLADYFRVSLDYLLCRSNERLMAHQLPKQQLDDLLTHSEKDFLLAIRRIDNESTLQNIRGVVEVISNSSNGGKQETQNTVINTPLDEARKELKNLN